MKKSILAGVIGTAIMTVFMMIAPMMGMPKMSPPNMLSGMLSAPLIMGWIMHFVIGIVFAYGYIHYVSAKLNIFYGWNYSGKTTISRIFQSFENKEIDDYYNGCDFKIEDYDGNSYTHFDVTTAPQQFKIFNSDFVRDNIPR